MAALTIRLPNSVHQKVKELAQRDDVSINMQCIHHGPCNEKDPGMTASEVNARVQKRHDVLRQAGLRRIQLWVPDTRHPGFAQECRRQCLLAGQADSANAALPFMDTAPSSVDGWTA